MEEGFELKPRDRNSALMAALMLSPSEANRATKKCSGKKSTVHSYGNLRFWSDFHIIDKSDSNSCGIYPDRSLEF